MFNNIDPKLLYLICGIITAMATNKMLNEIKEDLATLVKGDEFFKSKIFVFLNLCVVALWPLFAFLRIRRKVLNLFQPPKENED